MRDCLESGHQPTNLLISDAINYATTHQDWSELGYAFAVIRTYSVRGESSVLKDGCSPPRAQLTGNRVVFFFLTKIRGEEKELLLALHTLLALPPAEAGGDQGLESGDDQYAPWKVCLITTFFPLWPLLSLLKQRPGDTCRSAFPKF